MTITISFLVTALAVAAGVLFGNQAHMWLVRIANRRQKCPECKQRKRVEFPFPPLCGDCFRKKRETFAPLDVHPPLADEMAESMKRVYSDPEVMKAVRKGLGIQSEKEKFQDEQDY